MASRRLESHSCRSEAHFSARCDAAGIPPSAPRDPNIRSITRSATPMLIAASARLKTKRCRLKGCKSRKSTTAPWTRRSSALPTAPPMIAPRPAAANIVRQFDSHHINSVTAAIVRPSRARWPAVECWTNRLNEMPGFHRRARSRNGKTGAELWADTPEFVSTASFAV